MPQAVISHKYTAAEHDQHAHQTHIVRLIKFARSRNAIAEASWGLAVFFGQSTAGDLMARDWRRRQRYSSDRASSIMTETAMLSKENVT